MTEQEQKAFTAMREALKSSAVCIQLMSDGPSRASWGDTLDIIDSALAAANAVSHLNPETAPATEGGAITSESAANAVSVATNKQETNDLVYQNQTDLINKPKAQGKVITHSGADENPPVFGRRWKIAVDGFGLQRDDLDGRYVDIDDALSVLHAAKPQATEPAWRPIESAPKDGTEILLANPDGSCAVGWFKFKGHTTGWTDGDTYNMTWPTHWMPLPSPPEAP